MKTNRYSLKSLLTHGEIDQIIIPEIQRDYVWQKENVEKLIRSIINHFYKKGVFKAEMDPLVYEYLLKNGLLKEKPLQMKIGFIYAYHDTEYSGKFFLIDGQQRITTLYLLLLSLYKKAKRTDEFRNIYFKNSQLKVDYKVREVSHDFMMELVNWELANESIPIEQSKKYYKSEYENDQTVKNLISNYRTITKEIESISEINDFIEYVEDFVEFNYFNTNLSEQGEQLYLYMNSRGEDLSQQELVKSEIVKKENDFSKKKVIGKIWEDWQNYFWNERGKNENADIGFQEFLKWAAIIHMSISNKPHLKEKVNVNGKLQTDKQVIEDYIHRYINSKQDEKIQSDLLSKYQIETEDFDFRFISDSFNALQSVFQFQLIYNVFNKDWLSNKMKTLDYTILCPVMYYLGNIKWGINDNKSLYIERLSMFLKNIGYFETIAKNPDNATIDTITLVKNLCDNEEKDITFFLNERSFLSILTNNEKFKLSLYKQEQNRELLEKVIWSITADEELCQFIEGDTTILFECVADIDQNFSKFLSIDAIDQVKDYACILKETIFRHRSSNTLRRALLTYGDYLLYDNGGSGHFGDEIQRWTFINDGKDSKTSWINLLKNSEKRKIVIDFLKDVKYNWDRNTDIKDFLKLKIDLFSQHDWREPFIKFPSLLKYCGQKKVLWENKNRIILLKSHQAGNAIEIQVKLMIDRIRNSWQYQHNLCVLDFEFTKGEFLFFDQFSTSYFIDIEFEWSEKGSNWYLMLSHRNQDDEVVEQKLEPFINNGWNGSRSGKITYGDGLIFKEDSQKSILENVDLAHKAVEKQIEAIKKILTNADSEASLITNPA